MMVAYFHFTIKETLWSKKDSYFSKIRSAFASKTSFWSFFLTHQFSPLNRNTKLLFSESHNQCSIASYWSDSNCQSIDHIIFDFRSLLQSWSLYILSQTPVPGSHSLICTQLRLYCKIQLPFMSCKSMMSQSSGNCSYIP